MKKMKMFALVLSLTMLTACGNAIHTTEVTAKRGVLSLYKQDVLTAQQETAEEEQKAQQEELDAGQRVVQSEPGEELEQESEYAENAQHHADANEQPEAVPAENVSVHTGTAEQVSLPETQPEPEPVQEIAAIPAPAPEPEPAPEPVPAAAPAYGAIPFEVAAQTGTWWGIDSSDGAYWAVQENINAMRAAGGLPALSVDGGLSAIASARCQSFVEGGPFDHSGMVTASEICAAGPLGSASAVCGAWQQSPDHYANIMEPGFTSMGIGCLFCSFEGNNFTYWVVTFQ